MRNSSCVKWDLKLIVEEIIAHHGEIEEIYLFGSRAYNTGSLRSDIDLLAFSGGKPIPQAAINAWIHDVFPPVDLFWTYDKHIAISAANGSSIRFRGDNQAGYKNVIEQVEAILLWDSQNGFAEGDYWIQETLSDCEFPMSVIPDYSTMDAGTTITDALATLAQSGIKTYYAGSTWQEIGRSVVDIIETGLRKPTKFQRKARAFSFDTIRIENEYDFQNLIHLLLRPIFPNIESENVVVKIDGNTKNADFGLATNKIIIEAKHINTTSKKANVIKTLEGLKSFYSENPNVKCLVFLVLYEKTVDLDPVALQARFSEKYTSPLICIKFLENPYGQA